MAHPRRRGWAIVVPVGIMGLFTGSRLYNEATGATAQWSLSSPWSNSSHLALVTTPEGMNTDAVSIADALSVPPVSRAVQLISAAVASFPLVSDGGSVPWLSGTAGAVTARHRSVFTVQDILFSGAAVWWKDVVDAEGRPMACTRIPRHLWTLDNEGYVCTTEGRRLDQRRVIFIPALVPLGLLDAAKTTIRHYHFLGRQILNRSKGAKPLLALKVKDSYEPTTAEAKEGVDDWVTARMSENGAVALVPWWLELQELGTGEWAPLTEARNDVRLDVANFTNINAAMLDGNNGTSDTYSNTLQNQNELLTFTLAGYLEPIAQRLSQDDVTPPGVTVRFDTSAFDAAEDAKGNTGTATEPAGAAAGGAPTEQETAN